MAEAHGTPAVTAPRSLRRMVGNAGWQFMSGAMGVLAGMWALRIMGPHTYGQLTAVAACYGVLSQWLSFRSWETTVKYLARFLDDGSPRRLVAVLLLGYGLDWLSGVACFLVMLLARDWIAVQLVQDTSLTSLAVVYGLCGFGHAMHYTAQAVLKVTDRFRQMFWVDMSTAALRLLLLLLIGLLPADRRLAAVVWLYAGCALWDGVINWLLARRALRHLPRVAWNRELWQEVAGFRREIFATLVHSNLYAWIKPLHRGVDLLLLSHWFGPTFVGLFGATRKVADVAVLVAPAAQASIAPELSRQLGARQFGPALRLATRMSLLAALTAGASALVIGLPLPQLLQWWQPEYVAIVPACRVLLVGMVLLVATSPFYTYLVSSPTPWLATVVYFVTALLQLGLLALVVQPMRGAQNGPLIAVAAVIVGVQFASLVLNSFAAVRSSRDGAGGAGPSAPPGDGA